MKKILLNKSKEKVIFLGNEALVRGALEAGVDFVATYPGTPASEIGNLFWQFQKEIKKINPNFHFEFSTNEKVAMEAAAGAALVGARALVAFKHFGLNVASDFFHSIMYTGIKGAMVIFVADDPSCWSSAQSEQNSRFYSQMAHIPTFEPATPQEFKDFTKLAFSLSEKFKIPIMIRSTTRASHQSGIVKLERLKINDSKKKFKFEKNPNQFSTMPPRVLEMKKELLEKIEKIKSENKEFVKVYGNQNSTKFGILTSGVSFLYVKEALFRLGLKIPILKINLIYPLWEEKIKNFIKNLKKILVVEELEPYLEREVKILAREVNPKLEIFGKEKEPIEGGRIWIERKANLPIAGELKPEYVEIAISRITKRKTKINYQSHLKEFKKIKIPSRPPIFCTFQTAKANCPYWLIFSALKKVVNPQEIIFGGEIGCYMMARHPLVNLQDYLYCMGSSIGVAHGISKTSKEKVICFVGDSSFFHASIPALINTIFNKSNPLIIIFDNQTTAMTGHQPHPGVGKKERENGVEPIKIEEIVKACGVKNLKIIDQVQNLPEFEETLREFLKKDETSVIIARHICALLEKKHEKK